MTTPPTLDTQSPASEPSGLRDTLIKVALLLGLLYVFVLGLDMMGLSFKLYGRGFAEELVARTSNPFVGLFVGIFATTLVQSSSTTTSMIVGLVAAGALSIEGAVPMVMGANIGTSVTNTLVSLGHVTRREEFRRAFAGATLHDFFNWLAVLILLPLEITTGYLSKTALWFEKILEGMGGAELFDPLRTVVRPVAEWISGLVGSSPTWTLILGVLFLFLALRYLVKLLKAVLSGKAEEVLHKTLFRSAGAAILAGAAITVMVQSSSITTSAMVPLVGAGVISLQQLFPFTIGANIGTTVTALLASLATGSPAAITVALAHLLFNLSATLVLWVPPFMRRIPIALATWLGDLGARNRVLAILYIVLMFYGLPILLLLSTGTFSRESRAPAAIEAPAPTAPQDESPTSLP